MDFFCLVGYRVCVINFSYNFQTIHTYGGHIEDVYVVFLMELESSLTESRPLNLFIFGIFCIVELKSV